MRRLDLWRGDPCGFGPIRELELAWWCVQGGYWRHVWTHLVRAAESLNHPYRHPWDGATETHWGPLSGTVCDVADWLTRGWCHD